MPTVTNTVKYPNGTVAAGRVSIDLVGDDGRPIRDGAFVSGSDYAIEASYDADLATTAPSWSLTLVANDLINPTGTRWRVQEHVNGRPTTYYIEVPDGAGPYIAEDILDEAPGSVASSALSSHLHDMGAHVLTVTDAQYGATGDGVTDDSAAIQAAIDALADLGGGILRFPAGTYVCAGTLTCTVASITLQGVGGMDRGSHPSMLSYSGTGDRFIDARNAQGFQMERLGVSASDPTFDGILLDLSWDEVSGQPKYINVEKCAFAGETTGRLATCILTAGSHTVTVRNCYFNYYTYGIKGIDPTGSSLGGIIGVERCIFWGAKAGGASILNPTATWMVFGCTFEPRTDGSCNAVAFDADSAGTAHLDFIGNWCDDATAGTDAWVEWDGAGLVVVGNKFGAGGGAAGSAGVRLVANDRKGISFIGNKLAGAGMDGGIDFAATTGHSDVVVLGNSPDANAVVMSGTVPSLGILYHDGTDLNIGGPLEIAGKLTVTVQGDTLNVLRLNTERAWNFRQSGAGSAAVLDLRAEGSSRGFQVTSPGGNRAIYLHTHDTAGSQQARILPDGGLISFFGVTNTARASAYTQTYSTADKTLGAYTSDSESGAYTGAADGEAKLVDLNALRVAYENLRVFVEDLAGVVNAHTDDLQAYGLFQ